jgi:hypothetical protein
MSQADGREAAALKHFLDAQRFAVLEILEGLSEEQLRLPLLPSGWTPLGLIEHLGLAERHWFQRVATGAADPLPWLPDVTEEPDGEPVFTTERPSAAVLAFYRRQIALSDAVLGATDLDAPPVLVFAHDQWDDTFTDFRWIVLHLIEETARHAGHLDAARELIDGRVGLGPR